MVKIGNRKNGDSYPDGTYEEARRLRKQGFGYRTIKEKMAVINIPWSTIRNWVTDISINAKTAHDLVERSTLSKKHSFEEARTRRTRKVALIRERGRKCENCHNDLWMGVPIPLELDHIDGNGNNNSRENLKILCPNCHALTETYRGKNIRSAREKRLLVS